MLVEKVKYTLIRRFGNIMFMLSQRYLIASFIPPFLGATVFFVAFLLAFQLFRIIRVMIQKGVEGELIVMLLRDISLSFLSSAVPLAIFVAALYGLRRRSQDLEIMALHSLGFSRRTLLVPFCFLALLISGTLFSLQLDVIPEAKSRFKNMVIRLTNRGLLSDIKGGMFFTDVPDFILFAHKVEGENKKMERVFINKFDGNLEQFIFAQKGSLVKEFSGTLHPPPLRLYLTNGNMLKISHDEGKMEKILFKEYDFPLVGKSALQDSITKDSMRSQHRLVEEIAKKKRELQKKPDSRGLKNSLNKSLLEYWLRIQTPVQCIIFMFWGVLFGIGSGSHAERKNRGGLWIFLALTGYHAFLLLSIAMAKQEVISPRMAILAPNLLASLIVLMLFRKSGWNKKTL